MFVFIYIILAILLIALPLIRVLLSLYPELLWFVDVGYENVFLKILSLKIIIGMAAGLTAFILLWLHMKMVFRIRRKAVKAPQIISENEGISLPELQQVLKTLESMSLFRWIPLAVSLLLAVFFGSFWVMNWETVLLFFNKMSFSITDPLFSQDIGFYMFALPFYKLVQGWLFGLLVISIILSGVFYLHPRIIGIKGLRITIQRSVKIHLTLLLALLFVLIAWSYRLQMYELLYSPTGVVFGAGYTDIYGDLLGYRVLFFISLGVTLLFIVNLFLKGILIPVEGIGVLILAALLLKGVYPSLLQTFIVRPNEIEKEKPYIEYNIEYTRQAYGLNQVVERELPVSTEYSPSILEAHRPTLTNVRLWDPRPLRKTLSQLQEIRLYYEFMDVDIDRYNINGEYQQVMLSARELDPDKLPVRAKNWINQKMTYTHGHGVVMLPVNQLTEEGQPNFYIYDIPPKVNVDIDLTTPAIYYGEATNKYVFVNTEGKEFDYPKGDENAYTEYAADKGIVLSSLWRKLIFAIKFQDMKILFSDALTNKSKVLFDRNIMVRAHKIAPFLKYDRDPYIVVADGKLYWIIDAYVMSKYYPYAEPFNDGYNYIRNSVKVVVDAYSGDIRFYLNDSKDPLIQAYSKAFPGMFKPMSDAPVNILKHFRYPLDLFVIQARMYATYHMDNPQVFYNQEDLWVIPNETYEENTQPVEPYYITMELPEDDSLTFRLMQPFTPAKKNNMIAWMSAKCDQPGYGRITVYKLPKEQLIYGPMQIESRIDQDTEISKQLTLWGQKGSRVIRGNLLVIPLGTSFIYVEPIYLQATQSRFPELKQVVVANGNKIAMAKTFEEALYQVFGGSTEAKSSERARKMGGQEDAFLIDQALRLFKQSEESMKTLDWKGYGDHMQQLQQVLMELSSRKDSERE